jgi:hypothetical protein
MCIMAQHQGTTTHKGEYIMALTLSEIRAKLQASETRGNTAASGGDSAIYAHWNIPEGTTSRVRFLPDGDSKNSFFWVERAMIRLPFAGIRGQTDSKPVTVQVPCMEMYGRDVPCPILAEVRPWFKDPGLEEMGRKYWKKKSYLFQGFVRENALSDDKAPENPIRRFAISPQIFNIIKAALMDPEMEELPTDYMRGLDFQIVKTSKGGYADYSTSKWSRKESALTADEQAAIDQYGLFNLSDFLPKKPGETELRVISDMFQASVDGEPYDADRWGAYYKPAGFQTAYTVDGHGDARTVAVPAAVVTEDDEPDETPVVAVKATASAPAAEVKSSQRAEDILAMIRNRQKQ